MWRRNAEQIDDGTACVQYAAIPRQRQSALAKIRKTPKQGLRACRLRVGTACACNRQTDRRPDASDDQPCQSGLCAEIAA